MAVNVQAELLRIYQEHGELTPGILVAEAEDRKSPLHGEFDWNNKTAGHAWRLHQAGVLIRLHKQVFVGRDELEQKIRSWHSVRTQTGRTYRPIEEIVEDPFMTELLRRDMERDWRSLKARWAHFGEFIELVRGDLSGEDGDAAATG